MNVNILCPTNVFCDKDGTVCLKTGDAIVIVIVANEQLYDKYISVIMTSLIQFKGVTLLHLNTSSIHIQEKCCVLIFLNKILYKRLNQENINQESITSIMRSLNRQFIVNQSFVDPSEYIVKFKLHDTMDEPMPIININKTDL